MNYLPSALHHLIWCQSRGMSPDDVCLSVNVFRRSAPTWGDALDAVILRADEIERDRNSTPVFKSVRSGNG